MRRLISPSPNGGVPYQNSDFSEILQYESAWLPLSAIYQNILVSTVGTSSGLILNGIKIIGTGSNTIVEFNNPYIYLNGEALTTNFNGTFSYQTNVGLHLYEVVTNEQRLLRNGTTADVITNKTFTFSTSEPSSPKISFGTNPTYSGYESSLIENALNTFSTPRGEMRLVNDISSFDRITGLGFGKYVGWGMCDGQNGRPNLSGRVPVGVDISFGGEELFDTIGKTGGQLDVLLTGSQSGIQAHTHTYERSATGILSNVGADSPSTNPIESGPDAGIPRTIQNTGSTGPVNAIEAHTNLQPYYVAGWIIRL